MRANALAGTATPALVNSALGVGWRLISIPEEQTTTDPATVLASISGSYSRVYAYDCTAADWLIYDPADPAASTLTTIDHTLGLWVEMTAEDALETTGTIPASTGIPLCEGWNLIGYPLDRTLPVGGVLHTIAGKYLRVFTWDANDTLDPWNLFDVNAPSWASDLTIMQPGRGYWVYVTEPLTLTLTQPGPPPVVKLGNPEEATEITQPISATGVITSPVATTWTFAYRQMGESAWIPFAEGETVAGQAAGAFDPTVLLNDLYEVQLTATDVYGQSASDQVDVQIEGEMKIGLFTISFVDLAIPVAGIPLTFIRTYDSRDKRQGDFGVGWTLNILSGSYKNNRKPGDGWIVRRAGGFDPNPCGIVEERKKHVTEIRFSDVEFYRFKFAPANFAGISGSCIGEAAFEQIGGVPGATLVPVSDGVFDASFVRFVSGTDQLVDEIGQTYEPDLVHLTTLDGREFTLSLRDGLTGVADTNGNRLTIGADGVTHSSGQSVHFVRDAQNRITQIVDPQDNTIDYTYDANGDLVAHSDQEKQVTQFTYYPGHYLKDMIDARQLPVNRIEYDEQGRMVAIVDAENRRVEFIHNPDAREEIVVNSRGHATRFVYDERGNVLIRETTVSVEGVLVPVVEQYAYDARNNVTTVIDADGVEHVAEYNDKDLPTRVVADPNGVNLVTHYTYNPYGDVLTETTRAGGSITYTYNVAGNLNGMVDPLGNAVNVQRSSNGRITQSTDAMGNVTTMSYDSKGFLAGETVRDAQGNVLRRMTYTNDASGNRLTETLFRQVNGVEIGLTTRYTYDAKNRLTSVTDALGNVSRIEYNAFGREATRVDALGRRTTFDYDNLGRLIKTTYADATFTTVAYDESGNVAAVTNQANRTVRYEYDELNRRIKTLFPDNSTVETVYSPGGRVVAEIDARGNRTEFTYDTPGRITGITLPQIFDITIGGMVTPQIAQEYDADGNRTAIVEPDGTRTEFSYNAARQLTAIHYADSSTQSQNYDALGRVTAITDELGRTTHYEYDALGRLATVTLPAPAPGEPNPVARYTYDAAGNKLTQTDPLGRTATFRYDELNRLVEHTLPGGQREHFTYDAVGNLRTHTNFNAETITYTYDARNRLTQMQTPDETIAFTYTPTGRRAAVTDGRGTTSYAYDDLDRLIRLTQPAGVIDYTYDANGNLASITSPAGSVSYEYNALNALTRIVEPGNVTQYGYDRLGNLRRISSGGITSDFNFNSRRHLTSVAHRAADGALLESFAYSLAPSGRRDGVIEADGSMVAYSYDALDRLTREVRTGAVPYGIQYEYDLASNRTRMVDGGTVTHYTYDINDRLLTAGDFTFTYDANGNTMSMSDGVSTLSYGWDVHNRLASVSDGAAVTTYGYDADGNRVLQSGPGGEIAYLIDALNGTGYAQVLEERDSANGLLAHYTYGADLHTSKRGGETRTLLYDGGLNTRLLAENGAVSDRYTYDAFGNLRGAAGNTANSYRFAGEHFDSAVGSTYLRARWYQPQTGRFLSRDPFGGFATDPLSQHKYLYAHATPVNANDPSGHFTLMSFSIGSAISRSMQGMSVTRIAKTVCQLKETAANMGMLMMLSKVLKGLKGFTDKVSPYANTSFDLTQYRQSGSLDGQQVPIVGSYSIEVEHPLAKFPNAARTLDRAAMKKVSFKTFMKLTETSAGFMTPWMDIKIETFQGTSIGASFPYMAVTLEEFAREAEFSAGATLFSHTVDACGIPLVTFGAELETKHKSYSSESAAAIIAKLVSLGFLEVKATLLELKSDSH